MPVAGSTENEVSQSPPAFSLDTLMVIIAADIRPLHALLRSFFRISHLSLLGWCYEEDDFPIDLPAEIPHKVAVSRLTLAPMVVVSTLLMRLDLPKLSTLTLLHYAIMKGSFHQPVLRAVGLTLLELKFAGCIVLGPYAHTAATAYCTKLTRIGSSIDLPHRLSRETWSFAVDNIRRASPCLHSVRFHVNIPAADHAGQPIDVADRMRDLLSEVDFRPSSTYWRADKISPCCTSVSGAVTRTTSIRV